MKKIKKRDQFYEGAIALGTDWRRFADAAIVKDKFHCCINYKKRQR